MVGVILLRALLILSLVLIYITIGKITFKMLDSMDFYDESIPIIGGIFWPLAFPVMGIIYFSIGLFKASDKIIQIPEMTYKIIRKIYLR